LDVSAIVAQPVIILVISTMTSAISVDARVRWRDLVQFWNLKLGTWMFDE
jgi:hypothetical protein